MYFFTIMSPKKPYTPEQFLEIVTNNPNSINVNFEKCNEFETNGATIKYFGINIDGAPIKVRFKNVKNYGKVVPTNQAECIALYGDSVKPRDPNYKPKFSICKFKNLTRTENGFEPSSLEEDNVEPLFRAFCAFNDLIEKRIKKAIKTKQIAEFTVEGQSTICVQSTSKIIGFVQKLARNGKGERIEISNKICRFGIDFSKRSPCGFYTKHGKKLVEYQLPDGTTNIVNENVHNIFTSGREISGIITVDSICAHNLGLSFPPKLTLCVVSDANVNKNQEDLDYFTEAMNLSDGEDDSESEDQAKQFLNYSTGNESESDDEQSPIAKKINKEKNKLTDDLAALSSRTKVVDVKAKVSESDSEEEQPKPVAKKVVKKVKKKIT